MTWSTLEEVLFTLIPLRNQVPTFWRFLDLVIFATYIYVSSDKQSVYAFMSNMILIQKSRNPD